MSARIDHAIETLEAELAEFEPSRVEGAAACSLVERYARIERLAGAGRLLTLRQVSATGAWKRAGPFRDVQSWHASVTRSTVGHSYTTVQTAKRLAALPETESAARAGELSGPQLDAITDAATADPGAERALLKTAARDGIRGLRDHAARVKAAACPDEGKRGDRIRAERSLRSWTDGDGVGHVHARGPVVDIARIMGALEPFERQIFNDARNAELRESSAAYAFDALVAMANASRGFADAGKAGAGYVGVIRITHDAFVRGYTRPGEICELSGVGPIPVYEASRVLEDAFLKAVVVNGKRVEVVSHLGRVIPAHLRTAIEETYHECCIRGCHDHRHLEIDHNIPIEHGGRTEIANLSRLCSFHHRHKHRHNYRLVGESTHKRFVTIGDLPPPDPPPVQPRPEQPRSDQLQPEPNAFDELRCVPC